jgi:TonB family protein
MAYHRPLRYPTSTVPQVKTACLSIAAALFSFIALAPASSLASPTQQPSTQAPAATQHPLRIVIGGNVAAAKITHQIMPVYPPIAKSAHMSGTIVLHCIIATDGSMKQVEYKSGPPILMKAAMDAVRQWRYRPTLLDGRPVEVDTTVSVIFSLAENGVSLAPSGPPPDYSREPFLYEKVRGKMRYENDGTGEREIIARMHVQTPAGLARAGQLVFDYNAANERIEIRSVRVTKPDGSVITAGPTTIQDLSAPVAREAPMYTDARQKHVTVPGVAVGDFVEYDVVTTTFEPLQPGQFWQAWNFIGDAICLDEQLDLNVPRDRPLKLKSPPGLEPAVHDEGGRRIYHWAASTSQYSGPAVPGANFKFDVRTLLVGLRPPATRRVLFSTLQSWDEVARWYSHLESDRRVPTPEIRAQADQIVRGQTTDLEKIQALYEWVSRNVRYVSLSFGVGRYQPHLAAEVLQNRYGDCKDKTTLLEALLEAEGLHGQPVLINSKADIDADVPTPLQFDHAFTFVSFAGHDYWLDPTVGVAPFGYLLPQLRGKNALVASTSAPSVLRMTPEELSIPTIYRIDVQASLSADGKLDAKIGFDTRGDLEVLLRIGYMQLSPGQLSTLLDQAAAQARQGKSELSFTDFKAGDPTDARNPFHLEIHMQTTVSDMNHEQPSPQGILHELSPHMLNQSQLLSFLPAVESKLGSNGKFEQLAVKLQGPKEYSLKFALTLPPGKTPPSSFKPVHVSIFEDFAEYKSDLAWEGQTLHARWRLNLLVPEVPADQADQYADFVQNVAATFESSIPKAPTPTVSQDSRALYQEGLAAIGKRDYKTARQKLESVVQSDPTFASAWNDLGRTYLYLGLLDKAAEALHKAIEINPGEKFAYNNLGLVLWRQQKYDEAVKSFQKQLEINPDDRYAHSNLGRMYIEIEKYDLAVKELESASSILPNDAQIQLQLGRAYLNTDQPDKAVQFFDRAAELSPTALTWNDMAYYMSEKKLQLDRAQNFAESAISATSGLLRNISLDHLSMADISETNSIASYWDTMGWIKFQQGDLPQAEKYVASAWTLRDDCEIGDHLAQIYEKQGRTPEAIHQYGLALAVSCPQPETRRRLAALLGGDKKIDRLIAGVAPELPARRTIKFKNPGNLKANAEFWVLFVTGEKVADVRFISGDETMRPLADAIRSAKFPAMFPDATDAKLLRRGILSCSHLITECTFVLLPVEDVHSLD